MPTMAATADSGVAVAPAVGGTVPYFYGTNQYCEKIDVVSQLLDATQHEIQRNISPGGFLRGVRLEFRSSGGVLGTGSVSADGPWSWCASATTENIDGGPILYPMAGFSHMCKSWFGRPWHGDPSKRGDFSNSINPSGSLWLQNEVRQTLGVLSNTDARSQYRVRFTFATLTAFMGTVGTATAPTITVTIYLETWAQPDKEDLVGRAIEAIPPGMGASTLQRRQVINLSAAGADNTIQVSNMGNELRVLIWIMRNSSGVRADLASNPIRWRIDDRSLGVFGPEEVFNRMHDFYQALQTGSTRPAGVYVWPRFHNPGDLVGEAWMTTTNATYLIWETATAAGGTNGNLEIVTDEVVPNELGIPLELESV